jgi:streptogramin lyase
MEQVGEYRGITSGEGAVWLPDVGSQTIFKIDPQKNQVITKISAELYVSEGSIGVGEGSVWAVTGIGNTQRLRRYNAESGAEEAEISLPSASSGVVVDFGSVWITGTGKSELYKVDPKATKIVATIPLHREPRFLSSGEGSVWVLNQGDGTVQRIDGRSGQLVATIEANAAGGGGDISVGGGFVWVGTHAVPVIQIDPRTNSVRGKFMPPTGVYMGDAIRYGGGSLWVSGTSILRIKPPE